MKFGEWMDLWFREYCSPRLKASTRQTYAYRIYRQIIPKLGRIPLADLKSADLQAFCAGLKKEGRLIRTDLYGKGVSDAHIRSIHAHIRAALDKAVTEKLIRYNPAKACRLPPKKTQETQVLTPEEIKRLLIQAKEEGFFEMFFLDLSFGMRRGELLALRWDDINPDREEIRISGQVTRVNGKLTYSAPKTKSSVRTIRMTKIAAHVLKEYQKTAVSEWLFPSPHNPEVTRDPAACRKRLTGILEHAGCRHVRFHDLRHTFATMAIQNQIDIKTVSDILGHSTVETTINTYLHVTEQMRRSAADSIDRKIAGAVPAYEPEETAPADGRSASQNAAAAKFEPYRGKIRKRGTGYVKQLTPNCWQGRYTPTIDGKRTPMNIYAPTEEECERRLAVLIQQADAERTVKKQPR